MKKYILTLAAIILPMVAFAHDEGHGPKVDDTGKHGGILAPVVDAKDVEKGGHAHLVYKAELVRSEDGTVRVYYYDKEMKPIQIEKTFGKTANGVVETTKKKEVKTESFSLTVEDNAFVGKAPKPSSKPFNIHVRVKEGDRELFVGFDNLD
jgi:hypothetical protein